MVIEYFNSTEERLGKVFLNELDEWNILLINEIYI